MEHAQSAWCGPAHARSTQSGFEPVAHRVVPFHTEWAWACYTTQGGPVLHRVSLFHTHFGPFITVDLELFHREWPVPNRVGPVSTNWAQLVQSGASPHRVGLVYTELAWTCSAEKGSVPNRVSPVHTPHRVGTVHTDSGWFLSTQSGLGQHRMGPVFKEWT